MKKSEVIELIKESLGGFTPNDEKVANWILDDLLKVGMLPPYTENNTEHASRRDANGYVWEPEEPEKSGAW
jgi:hypothetical protein